MTEKLNFGPKHVSAYKMLKANWRGKVGKEAANISYH